jgi:hypothetical protein
MQEGWIKLYRSSFENELYFQEPFTKYMAWIDLLLLANHKDSFFTKKGHKIVVPRGTVARSMKELSERWKWSINKVDRFLTYLGSQEIGQVKLQKSNVTTLVSIIKYETYQSGEKQTNSQMDMQTNWQTNSQTRTYKNVKNIKENNIYNSAVATPAPPPFDVILPDKNFTASDFESLPQQNALSLQSFLNISKKVEIELEQIQGLWEVFKVQELTGVKLYRNKEDVYRHFLNWAKKQTFSKSGIQKKVGKKSESNVRPFLGEIKGLKFIEDFTLCEMEDGSIVKLTANQRDMAKSDLLSPKNVVK